MGETVTYQPECPELRLCPHADSDRRWQTLCKHTFANGAIRIDIPEGFECDLASVPYEGLINGITAVAMLALWAASLIGSHLLFFAVAVLALLLQRRVVRLVHPNGRHQRAAIAHDGGYGLQPTRHRATIDEAFRVFMLEDGVKVIDAWLLWAAVRLGGRRAWEKHRVKLAQGSAR